MPVASCLRRAHATRVAARTRSAAPQRQHRVREGRRPCGCSSRLAACCLATSQHAARSCGPARPDVLARLSPRGGGLLPVASTLSSVLRHLRNRATVSSSSSSCECAALCRATPSAHQTARAQHATHGSKRRAIARRFHFGLRGTREIQSLTKDDTPQHKN